MIPSEAVELAAKELIVDAFGWYYGGRDKTLYCWEQGGDGLDEEERESWREDARKILAVAAPIIEAQARKEERNLLVKAHDIICWMSGSPSFSPEGQAYEGWLKAQPDLESIRTALKGEQP